MATRAVNSTNDMPVHASEEKNVIWITPISLMFCVLVNAAFLKTIPLSFSGAFSLAPSGLFLWGFVLMGIDYHVYFGFARGKSALNLNLGFATKNRGGFCRKNRSTAKNACICVQNDSKNTQRNRDDVVQYVEMVENGGGCLTA